MAAVRYLVRYSDADMFCKITNTTGGISSSERKHEQHHGSQTDLSKIVTRGRDGLRRQHRQRAGQREIQELRQNRGTHGESA